MNTYEYRLQESNLYIPSLLHVVVNYIKNKDPERVISPHVKPSLNSLLDSAFKAYFELILMTNHVVLKQRFLIPFHVEQTHS